MFYFINFDFYSLALHTPVSTVVTVARAFATTSSVAILQVVWCVSVTSSLLTLASIVAKNCNVADKSVLFNEQRTRENTYFVKDIIYKGLSIKGFYTYNFR